MPQAVRTEVLGEPPDLVLVGGDVNSTVATALAAAKLGVPVAHVEAGLRSFDRTMPEEINRVLTDRMADLCLFTHSPEAAANLVRRGRSKGRVRFVGNAMIDTLGRFRADERQSRTRAAGRTRRGDPCLVTLHRPSNVDETGQLRRVVAALAALADTVPVVFPVHPRTVERLRADGLMSRLQDAGVRCLDPLGYLDFLGLEIGAGAIVTDSGGVQEEAAVLGVPCFTLRRNTERPVTITHGTNTLLGDDPAPIANIRPGASGAPAGRSSRAGTGAPASGLRRRHRPACAANRWRPFA